MDLERRLIEHCAPTLSGLKTASLFTIKYRDKINLNCNVDNWNRSLKERGIVLKILRQGNQTALIYVYRESMLKIDMKDEMSKSILKKYGYENLNLVQSIERLASRLDSYDEFPHEIGLFLGYPPKDVYGFICNKGLNCNLCSYWKVYGDEEEALVKFSKYDKCKQVYKRLWEEGRDILQLTVKKKVVA